MHRPVPLIFVLALLVCALDLVTKRWAEQALLLHEPVPILGDALRFTLLYNPGAVFGIFSNHSGTWLLVLTGLIILAMLVWLAQQVRRGIPLLGGWPIALILGGAFANFIDRFPDGAVTDFLDIGIGLRRWPTFNLADSFIVSGVVVLCLIQLWRSPPLVSKQQPISSVRPAWLRGKGRPSCSIWGPSSPSSICQ